MANDYNPIGSVGGVAIPCPSKYEYKLSDVSAADAGRTEDARMHKMRIAQKVHIELAWDYITTEAASIILSAFNAEYIPVTYLDPMLGAYTTRTFYVGDRSAPSYNTRLGLWSDVSFNIIEQ